MQTNIQGLVKSLELKHHQGMMPLFEAVSNAMDAIGESGRGMTQGRIDIRLSRRNDLAAQSSDELQPIDGFVVEDDGIGFDDTHFASFREAYTQAKVKTGGKGVGRFTYLKVFQKINVKSTYRNADGDLKIRTFQFSIESEVSDLTVENATGSQPLGTVLTLSGLDSSYASAWAKEAEIIGQRLVAHFLIRFAARSCPPIFLHDAGTAPLDLHQLFSSTIQPDIQEIPFSVGVHQFHMQVLRHKANREAHELNYCAVGRKVSGSVLRKLLPELPQTFLESDGNHYMLKVLVTGEYLDEHANTERTEILFNPEEDDLALDVELITRQGLDSAIASTLRTVLANDLKVTNVEKIYTITQFVESDAPEYRVLLNEKYRSVLEQEVPAGCSGEKLDEHLLRIRRKVEDQVRKDGLEIAVLVDKVSFDEYKVKMNDLIERVNDVGKSQLASYVAHRRAILDLLDLSLKKSRIDDKYRLEEVLHNMIFPMRKTSKDVFLEQQNLWVIDERLCFHTILTSDKKLKSVAGLENTSGKEPDIFAFFYDTPIGVQETDDASGAIVIIEFKRPARNDYQSDPAQQVIQRFVEIKNGGVQDVDGRPVNPLNLRYFGYLIADLTLTLRTQMEFNYQSSIDGEGYFKTLPGGNGYVEIISYDKLVKDAKRRNRVLFERIGLHKH